ncbi:hypothetical protein RN001_004907 [Aquatica leii]|uniref:Uncharacterized protein n=1 Tax=Aquatica leii TaxID=1421715 RepID=A0AAN7PC71_9COLE|nr:hypothetical protein RN001_004907 [Aquatica leii]
MDQQLSTLRIQRGYFKTTLTNFKKYLEKININELHDITIAQLETRLLKIEPLIDEFNKVHLQIKTLDNNDSEELEDDPELEIFENSYFDSIAKVKSIILNARKSDKCSADVSLVTNNSLTQYFNPMMFLLEHCQVRTAVDSLTEEVILHATSQDSETIEYVIRDDRVLQDVDTIDLEPEVVPLQPASPNQPTPNGKKQNLHEELVETIH